MTLRYSRTLRTAPADLRLEGNKVVHVATGKTAVSLGFGTDSTDAAAWRTWVGGA